jgi:hypothetical protein
VFYDRTGNKISTQQWISTYEPIYYQGSNSIGKKVCKRNQANPLIENLIQGILNNGVNANDIPLVQLV